MATFKTLFGSLFILLLFTACPGEPLPDQTLEGTSWILLKYSLQDGTLQEPDIKNPITLAFREDQASGSAGCNSYFAPYEAKAGQLSFSGIGATEMYCEGLMEQENQYLKLLDDALSYTIRAGQLEIISRGGKILFEAAGENGKEP